MIYARYNEAIRSYKAIQTYIQVNFNVPTGQVVTVQLLNAGSTYLDALNVPTTATFGSGLTLDIQTDGSLILRGDVNAAGSNYQLNEVVTVTGGDGLGTFTVTYIGKGHFNTFNGMQKQTAYWI
jgi:hypothetical protein